MSQLQETNAPGGTNIIGGSYQHGPTNGPSDGEPMQLHHQYFSNLQGFSHPLGAEIHENGADAHQPIMPRFTGSQYLSMKDLTTNSDQNYTVAPAQAPMLTKCGSQYSWMIDSAPNNVERDTIAPTQTTILTSFESQYSAVGDLANNGVEHHIAGHVQAPVLIECESRPSAGEELAIDTVEHHIAAPVQTRTLTKCDLCSEKGRSCNGNQANGKSCNVCIKAKQLCSFLPRKYACGLCHKHFTRQADLNTHNTRKHKQLSLEGPKESASTKDTSQTPRRLRKDSQQSAPIRDSSRPSKRARKNPKKQSPKDTNASTTQVHSTHQPLEIESSQTMATQEDQAALNSQTDSAREISNESSSKTVQREIPSPNGLYQPDSPAYEPPNELPHELHPTAPLSHPRQSSPVEHILAQNQAQESVSQQTAPVQVTETPVHSQSVRFTSPGQNSQVLDDTNTQNQSQGSVLQQFLPPQLRVISSSENARFSRQCQEAPVENTLANIEAQKPYFQQQSPIKTTGASIPSKGARISSPRQNSHVRDSFTQSQAQDSTLHQSSPMQPRERSVALRNSDADIYLQFPNRVMNDNHVENRLGAIREEIKLYEEFMRGKIKDYTGAEVEEQLKGLEKVKPFVCIDEVQNEKSGPFAAQPSRIVVLWRSMFDVPPTARLRDELVRFDLEGLKLPVVICGSLGYIILHTIFNEPDRLKLAEIRAGFECVKQLHGTKYAAESIKHDQLFIHEDKSVDRELRKPARDHAEHFYEILYRLTHLHPENPTNNMKEEHVNQLSHVALKSLRLSRELRARRTEDYSYFWPRPGELFNHDHHIDAEDGKARSQSGRFIRWTLMFGVEASREGQQQKVYAKAIVMTMEA